MAFWRKISPTGAARDFSQVWSGNPYRWRVLAVSIATTAVIMGIAIPKSQRITPAKPDIFYIRSFDPHRTNAQIVASNIANQKLQDEIAADDNKRAEFRKQMYRELGRATGLDVDSMERQIATDQAAQDRAAAKQRADAQARTAKAFGAADRAVEAKAAHDAPQPGNTPAATLAGQ